jgi:hypothetical protein
MGLTTFLIFPESPGIRNVSNPSFSTFPVTWDGYSVPDAPGFLGIPETARNAQERAQECTYPS